MAQTLNSVYMSPQIAKAIEARTTTKATTFKVSMRKSRDVPQFLERLEIAKEKTKQHSLQFDLRGGAF